MTKEEQMFLKHIEDLSDRSYYQNRPCFTDFLDMNQQSLIHNYYKGFIRPILYSTTRVSNGSDCQALPQLLPRCEKIGRTIFRDATVGLTKSS